MPVCLHPSATHSVLMSIHFRGGPRVVRENGRSIIFPGGPRDLAKVLASSSSLYMAVGIQWFGLIVAPS